MKSTVVGRVPGQAAMAFHSHQVPEVGTLRKGSRSLGKTFWPQAGLCEQHVLLTVSLKARPAVAGGCPAFPWEVWHL